jgi:hypothetical protein
MIRKFAVVTAVLMLSACSGSRVSQTIRPSGPVSHPLRSIALAPSGGILADAIGVELANRGYVIVDTQQTSALMVRFNATSELELLTPQSLGGFREQGIDAVLVVKAAFSRDDLPQSASVRLNSTHTS